LGWAIIHWFELGTEDLPHFIATDGADREIALIFG